MTKECCHGDIAVLDGDGGSDGRVRGAGQPPHHVVHDSREGNTAATTGSKATNH